MRFAALILGALLLVGCTNEAPEPEAEETEIPEELARAAPAVSGEDGIGTPMAERVAVLGLLNKRLRRSDEALAAYESLRASVEGKHVFAMLTAASPSLRYPYDSPYKVDSSA